MAEESVKQVRALQANIGMPTENVHRFDNTATSHTIGKDNTKGNGYPNRVSNPATPRWTMTCSSLVIRTVATLLPLMEIAKPTGSMTMLITLTRPPTSPWAISKDRSYVDKFGKGGMPPYRFGRFGSCPVYSDRSTII